MKPTLLLSLVTLTAAQLVEIESLISCQAVTIGGIVTCPNADGENACCAGGECCAGGCCPMTAVCINKGRGDEGCCDIDDPTMCGKVVPTITLANCAATPTATATCKAGDGATWNCAPGKACGVRFEACVDAEVVCVENGVTVTPTGGSGSAPTGSGTATGSGAGPSTTAEPSGAGPAVGWVQIGMAVAAAFAVGMIV
ncbi:hypothetical protein OQA88_9979 [Cercophora sp. LCS_1]